MTSAEQDDHRYIFVAGAHRSGTTLLHKILSHHPDVSALENTPAQKKMNEGQHLQSVFETAQFFGDAGQFAFDPRCYMDEQHPACTAENGARLVAEWGQYWDLSKPVLLEKSPPNIVRTRFLQALFPSAQFAVIIRHPLIVGCSTADKKDWCNCDLFTVVEHALTCYEIFEEDRSRLNKPCVVRYEDLVSDPRSTITSTFSSLGLSDRRIDINCDPGVNERYLRRLRDEFPELRRSPRHRPLARLEKRLNRFGYSLDALET